jgi:hypothetical protein
MSTIAAQLTMIALVVIGLGISLPEHGSPKKGNNNFAVTVFNTAIGQSILYWGGFYDLLIQRLSGP